LLTADRSSFLTLAYFLAAAWTLILINWIWLFNAGSLHDWNNLFVVNRDLHGHSLNRLANYGSVNLNYIGDGWANLLLDDYFLLDVVWHELFDIDWHFNRHFHRDVHRNFHSSADWHSFCDLHNVWYFHTFGDGHFLNNMLFRADPCDITFAHCGLLALALTRTFVDRLLFTNTFLRLAASP
jgi:hypothetical protein